MDVCIATLHQLVIEKGLTVVNMDKMLAIVNKHFKRTFSEFLVTTLEGLGHKDVATKWEDNGSVTVWCKAGAATIPSEVFGTFDAESLLLEAKTGLHVS